MKADAIDLSAARGRRDHVDYDRTFVQQPEEGASAEMADDRPLSAGESGGLQSPAFVEAGSSHYINAAEHPVQSSRRCGARDPRIAHPQVTQLVSRNHSMLPIGKRSQPVAQIGVPFARYADIRRTV